MLIGLVLASFVCVCSADLFNYQLYKDVLDSDMCVQQLKNMRHQFYDASFRTPEGLLSGNFASLGLYHQCLAINQAFLDTNIQGKYCLIRAPVTLPIIRIPSLAGVSASENITWTEMAIPPQLVKTFAAKYLTLAVCVPKTCTVSAILAPYTKSRAGRFNYTEEYCRLPNDKPYVVFDYVAMVLFSIIALLTVASTAYDIHHTVILGKDPKQAKELYRVCSLYTNTRRLLTFDKPRALDCLDGIRALSTLWLVLYHTYCTYFYYTNYVANSLESFEWKYKRQALWISSAHIAVDSFFTMSGLLLVYTSMDKMTQISMLRGLHWFYLHRYLRLFPLLACAVLLQASRIHHVADGPNWNHMAEQVSRCRRYWWSALLHVQNIVNPRKICVGPAWYLAVDMQLHLVSPLVLYWVLGGRRAAWAALAAALLASLAATLAICTIYPSPVSLMGRGVSRRNIENFMPFNYTNIAVRSPPFLIGMLFGYILHDSSTSPPGLRIALPQWFKVMCHGLALATFVYVIWIVHPSLQAEWDHQVADVLNNTFRRAGWALALCWLIFACVHGYGGPVNWFLSLRLWKFVARISYGMYLLHLLVREISPSVEAAAVYFSMKTLFAFFASELACTAALAAAVSVLVEEPAFALQRILFRAYFNPEMQTKDGDKPAKVTEDVKNKYTEIYLLLIFLFLFVVIPVLLINKMKYLTILFRIRIFLYRKP